MTEKRYIVGLVSFIAVLVVAGALYAANQFSLERPESASLNTIEVDSSGDLTITADEANDATLVLDADQGDDTADTWTIEAEASGNDLSILNGVTEVFNLTSGGNLDVVSRLSVGHLALTTAGPTDNVDVGAVNIIFGNGAAGTVIIGGFANGIAGQILHIVSIETANGVKLENSEGGGSQDIFLNSEADETVALKGGGWTLVCDGTSWYEVDSALP